MHRSRLDIPDRLSESSDHAHSPSVAVALKAAYECLAIGALNEAERLMAPYHSWPMSLVQSVRRLFVLTMVAQGQHQFPRAISFCEEAMMLCDSQDWSVELAELSLLSAEAHHEMQLFSLAAKAAHMGLSAWLAGKPDIDLSDADARLEVDLRDRLSIELFLLGQYTEALQQASVARRLVAGTLASQATALRAAGLEWTIALLHRWRGATDQARQHIIASMTIYESLGSPGELARLRIVAADIALDTFAPPGIGVAHYREDMARFARKHITLALNAISDDPSGKSMALLTAARLSRVLGMNEERLALIESVGHIAEDLRDLPLLCQVYTALGDEFGATEPAEPESQRNCYRRALAVVETSQAPAYGVWARRSLLRESEFFAGA